MYTKYFFSTQWSRKTCLFTSGFQLLIRKMKSRLQDRHHEKRPTSPSGHGHGWVQEIQQAQRDTNSKTQNWVTNKTLAWKRGCREKNPSSINYTNINNVGTAYNLKTSDHIWSIAHQITRLVVSSSVTNSRHHALVKNGKRMRQTVRKVRSYWQQI